MLVQWSTDCAPVMNTNLLLYSNEETKSGQCLSSNSISQISISSSLYTTMK